MNYMLQKIRNVMFKRYFVHGQIPTRNPTFSKNSFS